MQKLEELMLELTDWCPLKCLHCSSYSSPICKNYLSKKLGLQLVKEAASLGAKKVSFGGGEPTTAKTFMPILKQVVDLGMEGEIYTCGITGGTQTLHSFPAITINKYKEIKGIKFIFSIHGATSEVHDHITQVPGSFEISKESLYKCLASGIECEIDFVPMRINIRQFEGIVKFAVEWGIKRLSVLRFVPQGRGEENQQELELFKEEEDTFIKSLEKLRQKLAIDIRTGSPFNGIISGNHVLCRAGSGKLVIQASGNVLPCEVYKHSERSKWGLSVNQSLPEILADSKLTNFRAILKHKNFLECPVHSHLKARSNEEGIMKFPYVPFSLTEKDGDYPLLEYLQQHIKEFSFLREGTKNIIKGFQLGQDNDNFRRIQKAFSFVWPKILTDALYHLKHEDKREWDKENEDMKSFFDEKTLGTDELQKVLTGFFEFEDIMYGASPNRYRDHVSHSFRVWIMGHGILKHSFKGKLSTHEVDSLIIEPIEWECLWAIVALCHDIGYPLSEIERINKKARKTLAKQGIKLENDLSFKFAPQMVQFHDTIIKLMASKPVISDKWAVAEQSFSEVGDERYGLFEHLIQSDYIDKKGEIQDKFKALNGPSEMELDAPYNKKETEIFNSIQQTVKFVSHLQNKHYLKFLKSFDNLDHGIIGALLISRALLYFLESDFLHDTWSLLDKDDARQFLIRREILKAIASHTCQDIYHLKFDTLSFLLYMVDEIQYLGRPTLEQSQSNNGEAQSGEIHVKKFKMEHIDITITTQEDYWPESQINEIKQRIGKLRKMLRLAVGTPKLAKDSIFIYKIKNRACQSCCLKLENKKITVEDKTYAPVSFKFYDPNEQKVFLVGAFNAKEL